MQAVITTQYGTPDALQMTTLDKPTPKANEVLIRIHAACVGPSDCAFLKGDPFIVKIMYGLKRPKFAVSGAEFSGQIEAVGGAVTLFQPGDQVFGLSADSFGAHGEYKCLPETAILAKKPASLRYEEAVAVADGGLTALTFLRDVAKVQPGQRVLVNGASGAVGAYAVQLAKAYGAEVTGVCSGANAEMVRALGVAHVIDYTREDFTQSGQTYDVIFDAVGKCSFSECKRALAANGLYLVTTPTLANVRDMAWTALRGGKKAKFVTAGLMQNKDNLNALTALVEAGQLKPVIDRCYPLAQIADAYRYVDTGHKRGNVVISLV